MALQPNPYLVATSLLFFIPMTNAAYYRQWLSYSASLFLMLASSIYHATKHPTLLIVDKVACYYLTATNMYFAIQNGHFLIPASGCAYCTLVFHIGYLSRRFVYDDDKAISLRWHISMHLVVLFAVLYVSMAIGDSTQQKLSLT